MIKKTYTLYLLFQLCFAAEGEQITFTSANPFSFYHVITDLENQEPQEVFGILRMPENGEHKNLPLVIGVAGSLGWGEHNFEYLQMYRNMGIATFELQSFQSRGVFSTVGEQVSVTTAMMILDAFRALEKLVEDPRIDNDRVAITGWSLGGGVTLFSAWEPLKRAINPNISFAAHLAFYPPCFIVPEIMDFTNAPIHILIGELDNWTPAAACEELVPLMQEAGTNIDLTVYEESHHSFDRSALPVIDEHGYSFTDCRFEMRDDGVVLMNFMDIPMITPILQKISFAFCAERGPTYGGNPTSRKEAFEFAKGFMKEHLLSAE
ncbi:MAG: dienelactone hydrolase family protein [Candidatus Marinimicrobia bacterium]|nr:dienelactone hydrolase family protein [Candidatus Neomarinimicrobiota bacterium]